MVFMSKKIKKEHLIQDIEIIPLSDVTKEFTKNFDCGIKDLNDFLFDDALRQQKESINVTYLWVSKESKDLLGYITLCNDSIHLFGEKKEEMKQIGISYKALPALKICRMGVDKNYSNKRIGTKMIAFAVSIVLEINKMSGCRFLTLAAKNAPNLPEEKRPIHFYQKVGFVVIKEKKQDASYVPMYEDLKPIINDFIELERKRTFGSL